MIEPSQSLQNIFESSVNTAKELHHEYITIEHVVYGILCDNDSYALLESFGADAKFIKANLEHYLKNNLNDIKLNNPKADFKPKKPTQ
jgi:ATP-dependent Clp protease ATP-binding subunit ClpA